MYRDMFSLVLLYNCFSLFSYIGSLNLSSITLNGVMKALEDNANDEPSGVKAHFRMEESGLLLLESVRQYIHVFV